MAFDYLVNILKEFQLDQTLFSELDLENKLECYLLDHKIQVVRQKIIDRKNRTDLICILDGHKICVELKQNADISCVQQLDRYLPKFPDGIILVCWKCSANLREVFNDVKAQIKIPVELIELRKYQCLV